MIDETIMNSREEGNPIASGEYREKYISLPDGNYTIKALPQDTEDIRSMTDGSFLQLSIFGEQGQRVASDKGNSPGHCYFTVDKKTNLKIKLSRAGTNSNKIHYRVTVESGFNV